MNTKKLDRDGILAMLTASKSGEPFQMANNVASLNAIAAARSKLARQRESAPDTYTIHYSTVGKRFLMVWKEYPNPHSKGD